VSGGGKLGRERYEEEQYKRERANGGCLGNQGRRRTWLRCDKLRGAAYWPIRRSPNGATPHRYGWVLGVYTYTKRQAGELKHLSTPRKRNNSRSSGERTGNSLNLIHVIAYRRCVWGVESHTRSAVATLSSKKSRI
jgi:hypothetical protein